jgi:DNA-binding GntR family transcriptional regulator
MLVEINCVEKMPYRSYTVKQPNLDEIRELYDVRLALELFAVEGLAQAGVSQEYLDDLHQAWHTLLTELPSTDIDLAGRDEEFHETLAKATNNKTLLDMLHTINERLSFVRLTDFVSSKRRRQTCEQHLRILEFITAKDISAARDAMRQNIEMGRRNVETAIKEVLTRAYMKQSVSYNDSSQE